MKYYPRTLRERARRRVAGLLVGAEVADQPLILALDAHQHRMRTDPVLLRRRHAERLEANQGRRWMFVAVVMVLVAVLSGLGAMLPALFGVTQPVALTATCAAFVLAALIAKRTLLPATPPWALWEHYQAFDQPGADVPIAVAPWLWLLRLRTGHRPTDYCRVVDAATGQVVYEWARGLRQP